MQSGRLLVVAVLHARRVLRLGELLLFHQDADVLCEGRDPLVLHAHDREQLEHHDREKPRHAQQRDRAVVHLEQAGEVADGVRPRRQQREREAQQEEHQRVAFLELILTETQDGQCEQAPAKDEQDQALEHHGLG